ncbi:MAG: right-handed parallel beta-helix repeat-containing protein [Kiritimatiellae bacterium]|nr:right-handed parallel beta-helix repeat-containing protein [Kiritimatiellia bacterium]
MKKNKIVFSLVLALIAKISIWGSVINISPIGDDADGDGSLSRPFATLARAVEEAKKTPEQKSEIVFANGHYLFSEPVMIDAKTPVSCIRAANPGKAVLSGAVNVKGWQKDPQNSEFLIADFPFEIGANASYALVVNGKKASMALFPKKGKAPLSYFATAADVSLKNHTVLRYNKASLPSADAFKNLDLASVRLIVPQEWDTSRPYIASNDWGTGIFYLKSRTSMPLGRFNQGYRVSNSIHGMTEPGTWMYEGTTGKIRYWPKEGETVENINASVSRALRIITVSHAKDLRISGLVLEGCTVVPGSGMYGKKGPAAVIGGWRAKNLVIEDCEIRNTSGSGILVTKPDNMIVRRCKIYGVSSTGVYYADGGNGGGVYDCEIYNIGSGGVYLQLSNVTLKGCNIHHIGRSAATIWTTNGQIISNEFHHTMLTSRDGGAVYGAMNNSLFEGNYCHDCGGWPGLYNDEGGKETVYRGNKFVNCWWPFHMHQTRDIVVTNNIFACDKSMRFSFQGSANAIFRNNFICTPNMITNDKYVANCKIWENYVLTGSVEKGWCDRQLVRLEKKVMPPKSPCLAYPTKDIVFRDGKYVSSMFTNPWSSTCWTDRDAHSRTTPGVPGGWFQVGYDAENLYVKAVYEYNKFTYYKGCKTFGSGKWGEWDGFKVTFKGLEILAFVDGKIFSSDSALKFDNTNSITRNTGGAGAGGRSIVVAIPLSRLGLNATTLEEIKGKTVNFNIEFYNVQYKETRYYESPLHGELPGVIRFN